VGDEWDANQLTASALGELDTRDSLRKFAYLWARAAGLSTGLVWVRFEMSEIFPDRTKFSRLIDQGNNFDKELNLLQVLLPLLQTPTK